jgi:hypothetical protein
MFKTIDRSDQIAMDQVVWIPIVSRVHAWFRRCLDEKIDWPDGRQIIADANVAMCEFDTARVQSFKC